MSQLCSLDWIDAGHSLSDESMVGADFRTLTRTIIGLDVSHIWRGYGSAVFLEFGKLSPAGSKKDGSPCHPLGERGLCIEWSWRIEGKRRIWCGSWSNESRWPRVFSRLIRANVVTLDLFGRLPELDIGFSNGLHIPSLMTAVDDPQWSLTHRQEGHSPKVISVEAGRILIWPVEKPRWPSTEN